MTNDELVHALCLATAKADGVRNQDKAALMHAAGLLVDNPTALAAWARVLTEHTAPEPTAPTRCVQVYAHVELHAYEPTPAGTCGRWLDQLGTQCSYSQDDAVHRVEELTPRRRHLLEQHAVAPISGASTELIRLGLVEWVGASTVARITPRGRAWLEAHPREGGEPS